MSESFTSVSNGRRRPAELFLPTQINTSPTQSQSSQDCAVRRTMHDQRVVLFSLLLSLGLATFLLSSTTMIRNPPRAPFYVTTPYIYIVNKRQ
jgi:hypothetical protein